MDTVVTPALLLLALASGALLFAWSKRLATSEMDLHAGTAADPRSYARVEARNDTWRTIAQIAGGATIGATFAWTMLQDRENERRARAQEANRLYIEASKLLENEPNIRHVAAAHALGLVVRDRPDYHMPVRDLLVSIVATRESANRVVDLGFHRHRPVPVTGSAQAALQVLGLRDRDLDDPTRPLALDGRHLVGARFHRLPGFRDATFYGATLLAADFSGADLRGTRLDGANMDDYQAVGGAGTGMEGAWTDGMPHTDEWRRWQRYGFVANFSGADLRGATLTGAGLTGALFANARLQGADFSRANVSRADFSQALDVTAAVWTDVCSDVRPSERPIFPRDVRVDFGDMPVSGRGVIRVRPCP